LMMGQIMQLVFNKTPEPLWSTHTESNPDPKGKVSKAKSE